MFMEFAISILYDSSKYEVWVVKVWRLSCFLDGTFVWEEEDSKFVWLQGASCWCLWEFKQHCILPSIEELGDGLKVQLLGGKVGAPETKTAPKTNTLEILHDNYMLIWECPACEHQGP